MATTNDFRNGMVIAHKGEAYVIVDFQHVKPGKGGAFVRSKLKNLKTGAVIDNTWRAGEKINEIRVERSKVQYLYRSGEHLYMMDETTYEQFPIHTDLVADSIQYMKEGMELVLMTSDKEVYGVELPFFVNLEVVDTEPGVRGDTASGGSKPATLETGAIVQVPFFINIGDIVKIDTRKHEYLERVTKG
jgi:elongation factor P